ncbi:MAG: hypothetical protein WCG25_04995 [bacterium]
MSYNCCARSAADIVDIFHDANMSLNSTHHIYFALVIIIIPKTQYIINLIQSLDASSVPLNNTL